jgi:xanthine/CO dehydrogenase XdhC/CoxF family maturation factor
MLSLLIDQPVAYIGLLGPATKRDRMLGELSLSGIELNDMQMVKIYGPTGLDIGAETSEEIALSICAEIMSVMLGKEPIHLNQKLKPIHEQI